MDLDYYQSDSDSDSEGSLCDFIVDDESDGVNSSSTQDVEPSNNEDDENEDDENELDSIVNDLREDERALLSEGRPKRKRKPTVRYIDPDYCKLMELDTLSQREVDYIMNGSTRQQKKTRAPKKQAKPANTKVATKPKISKTKISKKKIRALKTNN